LMSFSTSVSKNFFLFSFLQDLLVYLIFQDNRFWLTLSFSFRYFLGSMPEDSLSFSVNENKES
jgi:hypothetical protein